METTRCRGHLRQVDTPFAEFENLLVACDTQPFPSSVGICHTEPQDFGAALPTADR